jgi:hypothetical protein
VELVDMHQGLVRFHAGSSMMITAMSYDISDQKFLLVLLSELNRINSIRIEEKRSQIVNMSLDLLS